MRKRILITIAACFYYSGLVSLARWWTRRQGRSVVVLAYHTASGSDLRRHLLYLRRHYRIQHLEAALDELYAESDTVCPDRRTTLVLTFDDGYQDNYTHGFALARELKVPITIFLIPGYIESGRIFWWLESKRLVADARVDKVIIDDNSYHLRVGNDRKALERIIDHRLRYASSVSEREAFLESIRCSLDVQSGECASTATLPMSWSQIREMQESGWVSYGAHTMHHPILSYLRDSCEVEREVQECREVLEQKLGKTICTFAYPVGQFQHIGVDVTRAVQRAEYRWALTSTYGRNTSHADRYLLKRVEADDQQHWLVIAAEAAGLWGFFSRLRWIPFVRNHFTNAA